MGFNRYNSCMVKLKKKTLTSTSKSSGKSKPVVYTGTKPKVIKDIDKWFNQFKIEVLYSKVRANREALRKLHGKSFDDWFKKVDKLPLIEEHKKDYIKYLKQIKNTKGLFKSLQKEIVSEPEFNEDSPPKNSDNSPSALAYKLNKISADAMGMSVADYLIDRRKRNREEAEYNRTHWVSPLTEGQIFTILYVNENKPYKYMGKPVGYVNTRMIENYKDFNKGWKEYKSKKDKTNKALTGIFQVPEPLRKFREDFDRLSKTLRTTFEPMMKIRRDWFQPFNLSGLGVPEGTKGLLDTPDERIVRKRDNGLNAYAVRIEAKTPIDLAKHYLKTHKNPEKVDYAAVSMDNAVALAETVGMLPQELFKITCDYIKLRQKDFAKRIVETEQTYLVEMLVSEFKERILAAQQKGLVTYTVTKFYNSEYVQNWLKRTGLKYDYKRFDAQLKKWVKIFTSVAKKKVN